MQFDVETRREEDITSDFCSLLLCWGPIWFRHIFTHFQSQEEVSVKSTRGGEQEEKEQQGRKSRGWLMHLKDLTGNFPWFLTIAKNILSTLPEEASAVHSLKRQESDSVCCRNTNHGWGHHHKRNSQEYEREREREEEWAGNRRFFLTRRTDELKGRGRLHTTCQRKGSPV